MEQEKLNKLCGERLKECIKESGMNQKEIAAKAHFTVQHISRLVQGKSRLTADTARILSSILHVKEDYLLYESDYPTHSALYRTMISEMQQRELLYVDLLKKYGYKIISTGENDWKSVNIFREHIEENNNEEICKRIEEAPYTKYIFLQSPNGVIKRIDLERFKTLINDLEDYAKFQIERCFEEPRPFRIP